MKSNSTTKLRDGAKCKVIGGTHAGKSGTVKDINTSVSSFNQLNQDLNKRRQEVVQNWENAEKSFRDELIPYYK